MSISKKVRFEIFKRDNFTCQYCGSRGPEVEIEVDHVHPRVAGGSDAPENLKTSCWSCNRGKGARPLRPNGFLLIGGPMDEQPYFFGGVYERPFLWVVQNAQGVLYTFEDEWLPDSPDGRRLRWGHPWQCGALRTGMDADAYARAEREGLEPKVIGGYGTPPLPWDESPLRSLEWSDANHLLRMLYV